MSIRNIVSGRGGGPARKRCGNGITGWGGACCGSLATANAASPPNTGSAVKEARRSVVGSVVDVFIGRGSINRSYCGHPVASNVKLKRAAREKISLHYSESVVGIKSGANNRSPCSQHGEGQMNAFHGVPDSYCWIDGFCKGSGVSHMRGQIEQPESVTSRKET